MAGDRDGARDTWRQTRTELEPFLKEQPDNYLVIGELALTNMGLGDKAAALALTELAEKTIPIQTDVIEGPFPLEILARVAAGVGEPDRAIVALEKLLSVPYDGNLTSGVPLTSSSLKYFALSPVSVPFSVVLKLVLSANSDNVGIPRADKTLMESRE